MEPKHWRALFISDVHLGTPHCRAESLLNFLEHNTADVYYLVGDIIDCWALQRSFRWPKAHTKVLQKIARISRDAHVFYILGNHDEMLQKVVGHYFEGVQIVQNRVHITKDSVMYYVVHGDEFDAVVKNAKWIAKLGSAAYDVVLSLNSVLHKLQLRVGIHSKWSLSQALKAGVKEAVSYIDNFEDAAALRARQLGYDGIICGHIHKASAKTLIRAHSEPIKYYNCGDWVESCTALAETPNGRIIICDGKS
jgi:UDP-2,3-diacylglucosamine pyrophosphatase LpxH